MQLLLNPASTSPNVEHINIYIAVFTNRPYQIQANLLKNHFLPNVLHTILFLEDWFTGKALLGLNNKIDKKPNKLLKDYLYVRDNYKCIQNSSDIYLKKKKSVLKN